MVVVGHDFRFGRGGGRTGRQQLHAEQGAGEGNLDVRLDPQLAGPCRNLGEQFQQVVEQFRQLRQRHRDHCR